MQSMFRLPWSTESPGDKIMEKASLHKSRPLPTVDIPGFMHKIKRKRTESPEPAPSQHAHVVKKFKGSQGEVKPTCVANHVCSVDGLVTDTSVSTQPSDFAPIVASAQDLNARPKAQPLRREGASKSQMSRPPNHESNSSAVDTPTTTMDSSLTQVQKAIEAQIDYEILFKHNELRLIEQELAKCQVSLEQLRRCSLIPFPGTEGLSANVSGGVGPALRPPPGYTEPQLASPWGVADGPYTRHYAKWLISDPKFDTMSERAFAQQSQGYFGIGEGRATRGSFTDYNSGSKARTSRTSTGTSRLQALGESQAPAPKVDPLLHKRSTDGQWVRLFCAQCGHSNFSNTQGFLNHCRIKHNQVFKSHDQAAIACGVPVDNNEVGTQVTATEPSAVPITPAITVPPPTTPGFVHPLVRSNPTQLARDVHRDPTQFSREESKQQLPATNLSTSPSTPYITALLQKRGLNLDLKGLVDTAQSKVDLDAMETSDDDSADTTAAPTPITAKPPQQLARLPVSAPNAASASKAQARPGSSKKSQGGGHARLPLALPPSVNVHMPNSPVDLSPHTVESNPGLVSDHDDDDDEDGDDARSQPDIIMEDNVVVEDASDVEGVEERTGSRKGLEGCFQKPEGSGKH